MSSSRGGYHHGDLAHALESAAMQLLVDRPAQEISLREVARAANVSHNAPYHHFADRNGLLKAIAERSMSDLVDAVITAVDAAADPRAAFRGGGAAYVRFAVERPHAFAAIYDPTVCVPGAPTPTMAVLIDRLEAVLNEITAAVGLTEPVDAVSVWGVIHGLGVLSAAGHFSLPAALAALENSVDRLLAGVSLAS
ncbi:TetR/AcrR family transcriptional regulator [Microbacterium nymphoidis]|uniref:TetR/AcrR family transcriptional regulator n=1 Tax=Microbacterium nymphoidis TaxID=2898586 RepID=UPI001E4B1F36|nr:TetR/AcrR family transcriptional regulator [Microbacterium nymphoidis]MCD2498007.1 TetR/AcrR family transcriptional regulator [Microbacterium nymphoidis]